jgi:hypothetical protein
VGDITADTLNDLFVGKTGAGNEMWPDPPPTADDPVKGPQLVFSTDLDGLTISFYATSGSRVQPPNVAIGRQQFDPAITDVLVVPGQPGNIRRIVLLEGEDATGLDDVGIVVSGDGRLGHIVDRRPVGAPSPAFIVSEPSVLSVNLHSGLEGFNLGGFDLTGGWTLPDDPDEDGITTDRTAFYSRGSLGTFATRGEVAGDVVANGSIRRIRANGADLIGDVVSVAGNIGQVVCIGRAAGGGIGSVRAAGEIGKVRAIRGNVAGTIEAGGRLGLLLSVCGNVESPRLLAGSIGRVMAIGGSVMSDQISAGSGIGLVLARGGSVTSDITTEGRLHRLLAVGGDIGPGEGLTTVEADLISRIVAKQGTVRAAVSAERVGVIVAGTALEGQIAADRLAHLVSVRGDIRARIDVDRVGRITSRGDMEAQIRAERHLGRILVRGDMARTEISVGSGGLRSVAVTGNVEDARLQVQGRLGRFFAAGNLDTTSVDASRIGRVIVRGRINKDTPGTDAWVHAREGRFFLSENDDRDWIGSVPPGMPPSTPSSAGQG